ncbi:hypothetical protein [Mucilaginibacter phyllosphaerae]|uniref:TIR domain-containing protein n=2 Tax=Mucilaginibacter phyllosphaerae TaxID=1812349 RepID=A0ABR6I353_9SPHI|nr:hypothetical protein [Mucilaginibacter phyllosphaerae]MBB3967417.1 hypothetical protein [Mucilaginibacter phyllosphaerae]GGH20598.1 hypothetical protein GCM10007352_32700 [Mucilaginibacter phyllosphaerae]
MAQDQLDGESKSNPKRVARAKAVGSKKNKEKLKDNPSENVSVSKTMPVKQSSQSNYPRHSLEKALRIPKAILEQNAGKESTDIEAAKFLGITNIKGPFSVELSSSLKFGFLEKPAPGQVKPTDLAKRIIRPQSDEDELKGLREAILNAPVISDVYKHYRGENLPDRKFFENTLVDTFKIPNEKLTEFIDIFTESLNKARLIENIGDKQRILDISSERNSPKVDTSLEFKKLSKAASVSASDTCFVMMPFAAPLGQYYRKIFEPAIEKAGLKAVRADDDLFGTGKIIDQIWAGITSAKVLIAELTSRNPNVYYELGLAHALKKPVVLVCSNEQDVPFDLKHIRVIYYDMYDPFWGEKLIEKVAENILSAIANPSETILF